MYIYLSNESNKLVDVYFDDLQITYKRSPVLEETMYYPFGQVADNYKRQNIVNQLFKYNAMEVIDFTGWFDYITRQYDPAIGRFIQVDPATDLMRRISPYAYAFNNPIRFIDTDGMMPEEINGKKKYHETTHTITMTYDSKNKTNTVVETKIDRTGNYEKAENGEIVFVERSTTNTTSQTIDEHGEVSAITQKTTTTRDVYATELKVESSQNPAELTVYYDKTDRKIESSKTESDASFESSGHFKSLVMVASEYARDGHGASYNFRDADYMARINELTKKAVPNKYSGGIINGSNLNYGTSTLTYYNQRNNSVYRCDIPHSGKVPMGYTIRNSKGK